MKGKATPLIVLLDEGTPRQVGAPFLTAGHEVIYHEQALASGAKDKEVVSTAILNKAVLIAVDADMKRLVRRFGSPDNDPRYSDLNLISIECDEVMAAKRIEQALSLIENEWKVACHKKKRRLWVIVGKHRLTTYR